jgi:hypothetical protein
MSGFIVNKKCISCSIRKLIFILLRFLCAESIKHSSLPYLCCLVHSFLPTVTMIYIPSQLLSSIMRFYLLTTMKILMSFQHTFIVYKKINVGLWDHNAVCVSVVLYIRLLTFECLKKTSGNFVCISYTWDHLNGVIHKSLPSVSVSVASQRLVKTFTAATNTHKNRRIDGRIIFYAARVVYRK